MKNWKLSILPLLLMSLAASPAWAAKKKRAPREPNEQFSAVDQESIGSLAPAAQVPAPTPILPFDPVPADQADAISKRLHLVEELVRKYGRAYDYRIHTVKQLEAVLAQLEAERSGSQSSSDSEI